MKNKSVLLKPNFGAAVGPEKAASTDARFVKSVLDVSLKQTEDVVIGDNPGNLDQGAMYTVKMTGILDIAGDHYYNISKEGEFVDIGSEIIPRVFISKKITEVDYLINVPKMKTHVLSGISCCIKNLYGYVVGAMKSRYHGESNGLKRLTQLWLDLYNYRTPDFHIVDAIIAMEGGGPTHGDPRKVGKIVAGDNGMEIDVVLTAMMGWDPTKIKKLTMAHEQGLGERPFASGQWRWLFYLLQQLPHSVRFHGPEPQHAFVLFEFNNQLKQTGTVGIGHLRDGFRFARTHSQLMQGIHMVCLVSRSLFFHA